MLMNILPTRTDVVRSTTRTTISTHPQPGGQHDRWPTPRRVPLTCGECGSGALYFDHMQGSINDDLLLDAVLALYDEMGEVSPCAIIFQPEPEFPTPPRPHLTNLGISVHGACQDCGALVTIGCTVEVKS